MDESGGRDVEVLKKLSANDLGWTGSHQAGIHIPKQNDVLSFFPPLDEGSHNPECEVAARIMPSGVDVTLRYIYYNGKKTGRNGRDEYRLTRGAEMFRVLDPRPGDLLKFRRLSSGEMEISIHHEDDDDGDFGVGASPPAGSDDHSSSGSATGSPVAISYKNGWTVIRVVLKAPEKGE